MIQLGYKLWIHMYKRKSPKQGFKLLRIVMRSIILKHARRRNQQVLSPLERQPPMGLHHRRQIAHPNMVCPVRRKAYPPAALIPRKRRQPPRGAHLLPQVLRGPDIREREHTVLLDRRGHRRAHAEQRVRVPLPEALRGPVEAAQAVQRHRLRAPGRVQLDEQRALRAGQRALVELAVPVEVRAVVHLGVVVLRRVRVARLGLGLRPEPPVREALGVRGRREDPQRRRADFFWEQVGVVGACFLAWDFGVAYRELAVEMPDICALPPTDRGEDVRACLVGEVVELKHDVGRRIRAWRLSDSTDDEEPVLAW